MDDGDTRATEPHEGEWIYVSAPLAHLNGSAARMADGIVAAMRTRGWEAFLAVPVDDERSTAARLEALRTADACVFDVSTPSADVGAEVATALGAGRPVVVLQDAVHPPSSFVAGLIARDVRARTIIYRDVADCLSALSKTLEDPGWIASVGDAAA